MINKKKINAMSFREQLIKCREDDIAYDEKCICCGHELIMCRIYGGQCGSSKCREARINKAEGQALYRVTRTWLVRANKIRSAADAAKNWDHNQIMVEKIEDLVEPEE